VKLPTSIIAGVCTSGGTGVGPTQVTIMRLTVMGGSAGPAKQGAAMAIIAKMAGNNFTIFSPKIFSAREARWG